MLLVRGNIKLFSILGKLHRLHLPIPRGQLFLLIRMYIVAIQMGIAGCFALKIAYMVVQPFHLPTDTRTTDPRIVMLPIQYFNRPISRIELQ